MAKFQFRLPSITLRPSPTFGIPLGVFGRGIYVQKAIVLHSLRTTLEGYDAQETNTFLRNKAQQRHPSVHFAVGYSGETHQYVQVADVANALFDYKMTAFPTPFPHGDFVWLTTYPNIQPDYYSVHIAYVSGELVGGQVVYQPASYSAMLNLARLIAYYCHAYSITCNTVNVVTHDHVDTQFQGMCADSTLPYSTILAMAQALIASGGETDRVFDPDPTIEETTGEFIVALSRISSGAYIAA